MKMLKLGWFSTGRDEAARDLLTTVYEKIREGTIKAEISFIFSNREPGEFSQSDLFFDLARSYAIPLVHFSSRRFEPEIWKDENSREEWRIEYDREVMRRLDTFDMDLGVLAGYMLIVGREMCRRYKLINLHPAAPGGPKGTWQEVIWELIEMRAKETGVMMHLVTEVLDAGPVITFCKFPIVGGTFDPLWRDMERKLESKDLTHIIQEEGEENPLFKEIRRHGVMREFPVIVHTIKEFADGNLKIKEGRVYAGGKPRVGGYDLTSQIDRLFLQ